MTKNIHHIAKLLLLGFLFGMLAMQIHALEHGLDQAKLRAENPHADHAHDTAGWELDFEYDDLCASCALVTDQGLSRGIAASKAIFASVYLNVASEKGTPSHCLINKSRAPPNSNIS